MAREQEIQLLMARFQATEPNGVAVQQLEVRVRTAVFYSANQLVAYLLQQADDRIDAAYQPKPGWQRKGRAPLTLHCMFGFFTLERGYNYHPGKQQGHYPADAEYQDNASYFLGFCSATKRACHRAAHGSSIFGWAEGAVKLRPGEEQSH